MRYPLDELLDKRSIIQLKIEKIDQHEERPRLMMEYKHYTMAITEYVLVDKICTISQVEDWDKRLYESNGKIWSLESAIRKGQIGEMTLEEIGKTAIQIRESNGYRVRIKGEIVEATGIGYQDIKINHASEATSKAKNQ